MAKRGIATSFSELSLEDLKFFAPNLEIPDDDAFLFPSRKQSILKPPQGYIGLYLHSIVDGNLRFPLSSFYLSVLNYFKCHLSLMHPLGTAKIINFAVMCKAYGGDPTVDLFRQFFQTGAAGDWVTIAKRPGPSCFRKEGLDIRNWKNSFFFIKKSMVPSQYSNVVDDAFAVVPNQFRDPRPNIISNPTLYRRLTEFPIVTQAFPEPILFLAGVAPSWEGGTAEPVILLKGQEMAFRNFVSKSSGKEASFMIKKPPLTPRDVGSPSRSEQEEASSKAMIKTEKEAREIKDVVDVELYQDVEGEKLSIAKRVSSRKSAVESSSKRKAPLAKAPAAKKGKTALGGKTSKENPEESEGSGDNLHPKSHYAIFAGTPEPAHCHRVIAACAPKGWVKGLDRMPVTELADLQSQSSLQLAIIDNVLSTKAREAAGELAHSQEEVEILNSKLMTQEGEVKTTKLRLQELEKNIESSEKVTKMKTEIQELRESLHAQAMEMAALRAFEAKCKSLGEEVESLRAHALRVEKTKKEVISKVIPHVCKNLLDSEEVGILVAKCINSARVWERAIVLEEVAASGETVMLSKREDYNAEAAYLFDSASEALANAQFPYVQEVSANPDASVEDLLSITPKKVPS